MNYKGGCHCGRIAFEVEGDLEQVTNCNCSICSKRGYVHWLVPPDKLRLITHESNIATYTFKSGKVKHYFCPTCGCTLFISEPEGLAVNVRCLDGVELPALRVEQFDGRGQ